MKLVLLPTCLLLVPQLARAQPVGDAPPPSDPSVPPSEPIDPPFDDAPPQALPVDAVASPPATTALPMAHVLTPTDPGPYLAPPDWSGTLFAPNAHMIDAGVIRGAVGLDTSGALTSDLRVGVGGVAEFGFGTSDHVRKRVAGGGLETLRAVPMARFVMALPEGRFAPHTPAVALGFQKSFERAHDARGSRFAHLYLVASQRLGPVGLHAGASLWDAAIERDADGAAAELGAGPLRDAIRPFAGLEIEARPRATLLLDLMWNPELELRDGADTVDDVRLVPMLSWGVRSAGDLVAFEAGVRVPDIGDARLLDAQVFANLRFTHLGLARKLARRGAR